MNAAQRRTGVLLYPENYEGLISVVKSRASNRNALINEAVEFWLKHQPEIPKSLADSEFEGKQKDATVNR